MDGSSSLLLAPFSVFLLLLLLLGGGLTRTVNGLQKLEANQQGQVGIHSVEHDLLVR